MNDYDRLPPIGKLLVRFPILLVVLLPPVATLAFLAEVFCRVLPGLWDDLKTSLRGLRAIREVYRKTQRNYRK